MSLAWHRGHYLRQEFFQIRDELKQNKKTEIKEKKHSLYSLVQKTDTFKNSSLEEK